MRCAYPKIFWDRSNKAPSKPKFVDWRTVESACERKRIRYLTQQRMWKTNRRQLVKVILDDAPVNPRPPAIGHVERAYRERFSCPRELGSLSTLPVRDIETAGLTDLEVNLVLVEYQTSASGLDKLSVRELKALGAPTLRY